MRRFDLGHQGMGYYTDRTKAVYWDGRNRLGEQVGSGGLFLSPGRGGLYRDAAAGDPEVIKAPTKKHLPTLGL